jgi:hypothetical protein
MAAGSGLDVDQLSGGLAGVLPQLIDRHSSRRAPRPVSTTLSPSCRR